MTIQEFRKLVRSEFGRDLRHMTPANVRDFLDRVQPRLDGYAPPRRSPGDPVNHLHGEVPTFRVRLDEPEHTYEGIVRDFLRQSLELPSEQAIIGLWMFCLECADLRSGGHGGGAVPEALPRCFPRTGSHKYHGPIQCLGDECGREKPPVSRVPNTGKLRACASPNGRPKPALTKTNRASAESHGFPWRRTPGPASGVVERGMQAAPSFVRLLGVSS